VGRARVGVRLQGLYLQLDAYASLPHAAHVGGIKKLCSHAVLPKVLLQLLPI
jgi:hypothetical protein